MSDTKYRQTAIHSTIYVMSGIEKKKERKKKRGKKGLEDQGNEASKMSIFIILIRQLGKGIFEQNSIGNVRDLYGYLGGGKKKEPQPEE